MPCQKINRMRLQTKRREEWERVRNDSKNKFHSIDISVCWRFK